LIGRIKEDNKKSNPAAEGGSTAGLILVPARFTAVTVSVSAFVVGVPNSTGFSDTHLHRL
jgi:hypothetical protein